MSEASPGAPDSGQLASAQASAGAQLRAARESYGLSIEAVAQHLKLAPRQVRALEQDAHGELPGRTFVRGFARNYAKLMQLDADAVVAALPPSMTAPADTGPSTIAPSARAMGELPVSDEHRGVPWSRLAILVAILALIAFAAVYEFTRKNAVAPERVSSAAKEAPIDPIGPPTGSTPLPNPLAAADAPADAPPAAQPPAAQPPAAPGSLPITTAAPPAVAPGGAASAPAATLVIDYRAAAWTEVRDANGDRLLVGTMPADTTQTVTGTPPFDVTLGNATHVGLTWRGTPFDLVPHIKANVARVRLP